jgi:ribosomal protein S18 acetylase RimI-like enzyme
MVSMEPYRLSEEHVDAVGDLLSAAFLNAPGTRFMFPDPARRARLLPLLFTALARRTVRNGEATALGAPLHAVALWMPPVREHPVEAEVAEAGMGAVALLDEEEAGRFTVFRRHFDTTHERLIDQPHWYLSFLAVDPGHQGQGAGTVLMRHMLDRVAPQRRAVLSGVGGRGQPAVLRAPGLSRGGDRHGAEERPPHVGAATGLTGHELVLAARGRSEVEFADTP